MRACEPAFERSHSFRTITASAGVQPKLIRPDDCLRRDGGSRAGPQQQLIPAPPSPPHPPPREDHRCEIKVQIDHLCGDPKLKKSGSFSPLRSLHVGVSSFVFNLQNKWKEEEKVFLPFGPQEADSISSHSCTCGLNVGASFWSGNLNKKV